MNSHYEESIRRMYEARLKEHQRMVYESIYSPSQNQSQVGDGSASGSVGGGNQDQLTPFILQSWLGGWNLYRLKTDGSTILVENTPDLNGPTVFSKNTKDGLTYFVTYNVDTEHANVGVWNQISGDWNYLEESVTSLRDLSPSSLQYVEGNEMGGNYFIYTDNNLYSNENLDVSPITWRIDLTGSSSIELTEIKEWEVPYDFGSFPISTFYQLPVAVGASPTQDLIQIYSRLHIILISVDN